MNRRYAKQACLCPDSVLIQIRQPVELREAIRVILVHDMDLHLTEPPPERHLTCGRKLERPEQQNLVAQEGAVNSAENFVVEFVREIDSDDLRAEIGSQRANIERPVLGRCGFHGTSEVSLGD